MEKYISLWIRNHRFRKYIYYQTQLWIWWLVTNCFELNWSYRLSGKIPSKDRCMDESLQYSLLNSTVLQRKSYPCLLSLLCAMSQSMYSKSCRPFCVFLRGFTELEAATGQPHLHSVAPPSQHTPRPIPSHTPDFRQHRWVCVSLSLSWINYLANIFWPET